MNAQKSWQILFTQALTQSSVDSCKGNNCSLLDIYEYIYRALNQAGIHNRPPLAWHQVFAIWWRAKGDADAIKLHCIQAIQNMQRPVFGFQSSSSLVALLTLSLLLISLMPQTANTFRTLGSTQSILRIKPQPIEDLDRLETFLPTSSDYLYAANQFLGKPILFEREYGLYGSDWIKSQNDNEYSLQLISTSTREALIDFCKQHNICNNAAFYAHQVNGKTYYRLLYGHYENNKSAQIALSTLSSSLLQLKPWARKFRQIKSEI